MGYSGCPLLRGPFIGGIINWCRSGGGHSETCITQPNKKWLKMHGQTTIGT